MHHFLIFGLSTKMAILHRLIVRSGLPKTELLFFLYLIPLFHNALASLISIFVPLPFMACMFLLRCSLVSTSIIIARTATYISMI